MDTIKVEKKQVKMIAHRGVCGLEMENTIAAFIAAGNRSYFGIETDTHTTADKQFAVIHDGATKRISAEDKNIKESTLEELQQIPLYDREVGCYRSDLRIPNVREYIQICKKYDKTAVLETKGRWSEEEIKSLIEFIKELDYLEHVIFISFSWNDLEAVRAVCPEQKVQYLVAECDEALADKMIEAKIELDISYRNLTPELIEKFHAAGLEVNCFTVNDPEEAKKLIDWGVDYITSNILE